MGAVEQALLALSSISEDAWRQPRFARSALFRTLLEAAADDETVQADTIGRRNQRMLALHAQYCGGGVEACAACDRCATTMEFDLPAESILTLPASTDAAVEHGGARFRLPRVADLEDLGGPADASLPVRIAHRCKLEGEVSINEAFAETLGAKFDAADPAANIRLTLNCAGCENQVAVAVDVAPLVIPPLLRVARGLLHDIDRIASSYGWSEDEILALPPERRKQYVALIALRQRGSELAHSGGRRA
nr:hypothetical protein [uncultured Sphingomonas sp.]